MFRTHPRAGRCLIVALATLVPIAANGYAQRISVAWQKQELGKALERLTETGSLELWLDRRVDPTQRVSTTFSDVLVEDAIDDLVKQYKLSALRIGNLVYVGPPRTARGLAALLLQARAAPTEASPQVLEKWRRATPVRWPRLTQPGQLLEKLLADAGVKFTGLEQVPHDLWAQRNSSPLPLSDQVVLILAGFDLTCDISTDGLQCRIVPIEFPLPDETKKLLSHNPQSSPAERGRSGKKLFSLKLKNQRVDRVIEQVAPQLGYTIGWDEQSLALHQRSKTTLVSCEVKNAEFRELLSAILNPAGMDYSLVAGKLTIRGVP